jgi:hypothetical protein
MNRELEKQLKVELEQLKENTLADIKGNAQLQITVDGDYVNFTMTWNELVSAYQLKVNDIYDPQYMYSIMDAAFNSLLNSSDLVKAAQRRYNTTMKNSKIKHHPSTRR